MASPYQIAGTRASLADLLQQSNLQQQQSQRAGSKQMGEMQEKFEDELEKLQSDARKRSKKNKGLGSLLNIAALGLGPLGAGIAKGLYSEKDFLNLHRYLKTLLDKKNIYINDIEYCPYHPKAKIKKYKKNSQFRKPGNLMIEKIKKKWLFSNKNSFMIGDNYSDKLAAKKSKVYF